MPKVKGVKSLSQLCIDFVTDNMDYWCPNHFNELQRIADAFNGKWYDIGKEFAEILLTEKTRHLDVQHMQIEEMDNILKIAAIKCPALRSMQMMGDCENIVTYIPKFDRMQILMISRNLFIDDNSMKTVGTFCKELRILDITNCTNVTDVGIKGLCVSVDCQNETGRSGQCKLIQKLDIEMTGITRKGVLMAIENLSFLQVLLHHETLDALAKIHQKALDQNILPIPSFSLTSLIIGRFHFLQSSVRYNPGSLGLAVNICPLVTVAHITAFEGMVDSDLQSLLALNSLVELGINSEKSVKITFDGGVIPLLKSLGCSLEVLHLAGVQGVNVGLMAEYCPNLLSLTLFNNAYSKTRYSWWESSISPKKTRIEIPILLKLEKISILNYIDRFFDLPSETYLLLLSSPLLKCITIHGCEVLSDKILQDAANIHHFLHLEELNFFGCDGVSEQGIDVFMNDLVPLREIIIDDNRLLNRKIADKWKMESSKKNWELSISYSDLNSSDEDDEEDSDE